MSLPSLVMRPIIMSPCKRKQEQYSMKMHRNMWMFAAIAWTSFSDPHLAADEVGAKLISSNRHLQCCASPTHGHFNIPHIDAVNTLQCSSCWMPYCIACLAVGTKTYLWVTAKFMFSGLLKSNFRPSNRSGFRDTAIFKCVANETVQMSLKYVLLMLQSLEAKCQPV